MFARGQRSDASSFAFLRRMEIQEPSRVCTSGAEKTLNGSRGKGIYIRRTMHSPQADSIHEPGFHELGFRAGDGVGSSAKSSAVEVKIMDLFAQFRNPLLRYVNALGLSVHDGEEIVQEVFLALFRHLQMGKSERNLRGWIFRVAHNLALKQRCANRKAQATFDSDEALVHRQPDLAPNPEEQAASNQRLLRLQAVLRALPEQDRCCLYLRAEGLRYREIAATLGVSLGAVSIALARSLARMQRANQG
jgi:RNA polymerase sigma-70 factor, ECF subfamily